MSNPKIKFTIITLFEDALRPYLNTSMMWKAQDKGIAEFDFVNLRDFGIGPHQSVDDTPYGGGDGMVLRCEPVYAAIESIFEKAEQNNEPRPEVILPTPGGRIWDQEFARELAGVAQPDTTADFLEKSITKTSNKTAPKTASETTAESKTAPIVKSDVPAAVETTLSKHYVILCPHYEGYDARILDIVDYQISLGKYVLTGGELPALIIIDSVVRLLPGVLGGDTSVAIESYSNGDNIEAPQYTKPYDFRGKTVPDVLLSGDHGKVAKWRKNHEKR